MEFAQERSMSSRSLAAVALRVACASAITLCVFGGIDARAAHELKESPTSRRVYGIGSRLEVKGQVETSVGEGKATAHTLHVTAAHRYRERRMSGTGRDAETLRSLRDYADAEAKIEIGGETTSSRLRENRRRIVARGQRSGVTFYSPTGPLTYGELELLRTPGDSLAVIPLLPPKGMEVGETWSTDSWVIQTLTGTDAMVKGDLTCKLETVQAGVAKVTFQGSLEGATAGASTNVEVSGHYLFDLQQGYWKHLEVVQKEKRTVGAVTPGLSVEAVVVVERAPAQDQETLNDGAIAQIPLEPAESVMLLDFRSPWNVRFSHDRDWHVFHQSERVAILRLLDKGSLIAQCNITQIPSAEPGKRTSEEQFQRDISTALGDKLKKIEKAEQLTTDDDRFLYRVTTSGEANGLPMKWIYYLCADSTGRQVALVFAIEEKLIDQLANRDLGIVNSVEFLSPITTTKAQQ
jgi:hypothetical protein